MTGGVVKESIVVVQLCCTLIGIPPLSQGRASVLDPAVVSNGTTQSLKKKMFRTGEYILKRETHT